MSTLGYMIRQDPCLPRPTRIKNKTPAPIQITAVQIIREARERHHAADFRPPKSKITDAAELAKCSSRKRKEFENLVRRPRSNSSTGVWIRYAQWEASQNEFSRARCVWERALAADYKNHALWVNYAEMEMKNKFINQARNVLDRAVTLLPRIDKLWYMYIHMEEMLGNVVGARRVFERWMKWTPEQQGWQSYIEFELRHREIVRARGVFDRFEQCHPSNEVVIAIKKHFVDREEGIDDDALTRKRRFQYEDEVRKNPLNYDSWFDYIWLEESEGNRERVREIYERAIANVPPVEEKRYWWRYIYLWIKYALFEELNARDAERTRDVYRACLDSIPHKEFSFAKVWLLAAQFEIRQLNLEGARRILGNAIGKAPHKDKIFKKYIEMELQLGNIDRCRKLYEKYLEWLPQNCYAWSKYGELERSLSETDRARSIFELAIAQPVLDMPEMLWQAYIDFETAEGEFERARALYKRLLDRTKHLKVWISYAEFEATAVELERLEEEQKKKQCIQRARRVFEEALNYFRSSSVVSDDSRKERVILLEKWLNLEASSGELGDVSLVQSKLPRKLKRKRKVFSQDGSTRTEEFIDYLFPEEKTTNRKILNAANIWKKQKLSS